MRKSNRGKEAPYVKPVKRVELSEWNVRVRMILIVVFLSIAVVAIVSGIRSVLRTEPGWQEVVAKSDQPNCSEDFVLNYDFSGSGSGATAQFKTLTALYTTACEDAFRCFSPDVQGSGSANVHDLNAHPNEIVTVDSLLYNALALAQQYQNRGIFLGGIYAEYGRIFYAETEVEAELYDPSQNAEQRAYIAELASYANDPAMIDVQLLGDNQVKLLVSEEYLACAEENEIVNFVDFGWMKNAFIADYLAQILMDNGFTNGYLASFDGFTRNLDQRGNSYSVNIFDRDSDGISMPAVLTYTAPASLVFLRDYPMGKADVWQYYAFQNGRIVNLMIDPLDGMNKAAVDSLFAYTGSQSCAEVLLQLVPVVIADVFSEAQLQTLATEGVHSIWCEGQNLLYTDHEVNLTVADAAYTKAFAG